MQRNPVGSTYYSSRRDPHLIRPTLPCSDESIVVLTTAESRSSSAVATAMYHFITAPAMSRNRRNRVVHMRGIPYSTLAPFLDRAGITHSVNSATTRLQLVSDHHEGKGWTRDAPRVVKLLESAGKHVFFLVLLQKGIPLSQPVVLIEHPLEHLQCGSAPLPSSASPLHLCCAGRYDSPNPYWCDSPA